VPADVPPRLADHIRALAIRTFAVLCCEAMARVDFFLSGEEVFSITGLAEAMADGGEPPAEVLVSAERDGREPVEFPARVRIDTPREAEYFRHGGILQFVLRALLAR